MDQQLIIWANRLIWFSIIACIAVFLVFLFGAVHWHFAPEAYESWYLHNGFQAGLGHYGINQEAYGGIPLSNLSSPVVYWLVTRSSLLLGIILYMLYQSAQILSSIQSLQTFYTQNIRSFHKLSIAAFCLAVLASFNLDVSVSPLKLYIGFPIGPILLSVGFRVLEAVFSEGKNLADDVNSFI